jgi:outer membrane protein
MKRLLLLLAVSVAPLQAQEPLSLEGAIATALEANRSLRSASHVAESSRWGKLNAVTRLLPKVSLESGLTRIDPESERRANAAVDFIREVAGPLGIPSSALSEIRPFAYRDTYTSLIRVVQPVFNGGAEIVGLRAAGAASDRDGFSRENTQQEVIARVKVAYYSVLKAQELVALSKESVQRSQRHLEMTRRRQEAGMRTAADVLRWEVQRASDQGTLIGAENVFSSAQLQLNEVMGVELTSSYTLQGVLLDSALSAEPEMDSLRRSIDAHPAMQAMKANLRLADLGVDREYTNFLPRINLAFQYGWEQNNTFALDGIRPWAVALSVSYPIFSSFGDYTSLQQARETYQATQEQADAFRRGLQRQASDAALALRAAKERTNVARKAQQEADEVLGSVTRRYEMGGASNVDLIDAQTAYTAARTDFITAQYDYLIAEVQLARARGTVRP